MSQLNKHSSPKVAIQALRSLLYYGERHGEPIEPSLDLIGIAPSLLNNSRHLIDVAAYEAVLNRLSLALNDGQLGFHVGQEFQADRWGILSYIAVTSSSIFDALQSQYTYQSLAGNMGTPHRSVQGNRVHIEWVPSYDCSSHMAEQIITGLVTMARYLANQDDYSPHKVCFTHACSGDPDEYTAFFRCPVLFQQDANEIQVNLDKLNQPLFRHDAELNALLKERADKLLEELTESSPVDVIRDYILKTLADHVPDIEEVAQVLNVSSRTLQRKLKEQGMSYSGLLDDIRKDLAITYLTQTENSLLLISQRLGFSEQSAFQRAFKRWTGSTPNHYKSSH